MSDEDLLASRDSFEVEIIDLDPPEHAGNVLSARLGRLLLRWQRPENRRARLWLNNGLLTCLVLVLLIVLFSSSTGLTSLLTAAWPFSAAQSSVPLNSLSVSQAFAPVVSEIRCPVDSAWSPDSSLIALLGYTQSCSQKAYTPAQIDLYAAASGRQVAQWSPDKAIIQAMQRFPGVSASMEDNLARKPNWVENHGATPVVYYTQILWSANHSRLALSFVATNYVFAYAGLLLANADGSQAQVLLQPEHDEFSPNTGAPLLWDLQSKSVTTFSVPAPALVYTWNMQDQLTPLVPLDAHTDLSTYLNAAPGSPTGGRSFTIWQPGRASLLASSLYLWSTSFAIWSPDERYLITNFAFAGLTKSPGQAFPSDEELHTLGVNALPRLPAHDLALLSAAAHARALAWNPAGTLLAVDDAMGMVGLYDCQTGHLLRQLTARKTTPLSPGSATLLSWSPDGHYLQLSSPQEGSMTLWGPALLPHADMMTRS